MSTFHSILHPLIYRRLCTITPKHNTTKNTVKTYTRCMWAGGTFFPVVILCQFLVLAGNRFRFYILMYLVYNTVVVLC
jgi:hypothetical protein